MDFQQSEVQKCQYKYINTNTVTCVVAGEVQ